MSKKNEQQIHGPRATTKNIIYNNINNMSKHNLLNLTKEQLINLLLKQNKKNTIIEK